MPLRIKTESEIVKVQVEQNESDLSLFSLNLGELGGTQIEYPLETNGHFESIENYDIYLFKNRFRNLQRDIFQVSIKSCSIAWILPLSIYNKDFSEFLTDDNTTASKTIDIFLKLVAYPAFHKLLLAENIPSKISEQNSDYYKLSDFYDSETKVLIVSKERLESSNIVFDINLYLPSLYKYGYVLLNSDENFYDIDSSNTNENVFLKDKKNFDEIKIYSLASDLLTETYIIELFRNVLKIKLHALVRFHFLYQVIELLINKIGIAHYKKELPKKISDELKNTYSSSFENLISGNFQSVNEIKGYSQKIDAFLKSLNYQTNEEDRIEMLFECSKIKNNGYENLLACSKTITGMIGGKLYENIYKVRNALVHSYHDLYKKDNKIDEKIQELNTEFEYMIVDILKEYSYQ